MISLKLQHSHHLPCHPTRTLQQPSSIHETDREQFSQCQQNDYYYENNNNNDNAKVPNNDDTKYQNSQSKSATYQNNFINVLSSIKKKKPIYKLTPQEIYQTDVITQTHQLSAVVLPANIRVIIMQKQKLVQDKVYLGISQEKGSNLLQRIYSEIDTETHLKDRTQENLIQMMNSIEKKFENDIVNDNMYKIHKIIRSTKQSIALNRKKSMNNDTTFNSQSITDKIDSDSSSNPTQYDFSLGSSKTKQAQLFIKKIQQQQWQQRKRRKQKQQNKNELEVKSMEQKKQFEQEIKNQRKNYLKRRIQAKKQLKQKQLEVRQKMNKEYKQFLNKYKSKTPLFQKKQQKFRQLQEQEKKKIETILKKRKSESQVNLQQLKQHEKRYKSLKQQKQNQKIAQKRIRQKESKQMEQVKYFRSRYYDVMVQQQEKQKQKQVRNDPRLLRSQLIKKQRMYARAVRENYIPKSDEAKQKQLKQMIQKLQWTQKLKNGKLDIKERNQAGNQYLQRLHQLIADLRSKNKLPLISKTIDYEQLQKSTKPQYKNYLSQGKLFKRRHSIDYSQIQQMDLQQAQSQARRLQQKAKKRQVYINNKNFNIDRTLSERKKIDDDFLESVKVKMALLNKYD